MKKNMHIARIALPLAVLMLGACATSSPTINTQAAPEDMSYDGLYPVDGTRVTQAWARADLDLRSYNKILLQGAGIQYRPVKSAGYRGMAGRSGKNEFPLDEQQKERVAAAATEAFRGELGKIKSLEIVTEPGPDVLIVRGALLDVVSRVPPDPVGRSNTYLDSVGEATLVIELADSQSGSVLVRAVDRRAAQQTGWMTESTSVTNAAEVRRLFSSWARLVRTALEELTDDLDIGETR
ncbi:MAG: DUF3313 family protein [Pseudomonadales bacterium]|nr:DUF3313 domain-containing protein [Pseudomonadales bacterium]NIX08758.1 DUF3313 family protein [Pseudomonadales bacterium]